MESNGSFLSRLKNSILPKKVELQKPQPNENERFGGLKVETLGVEGETLAPKVDWNNPPGQIPKERVTDMAGYATKTMGIGTEAYSKLISNIRYISPELTEKAFSKLSDKLKLDSEQLGKDFVLVHDGEDDGSRKWVCAKLSELSGFKQVSTSDLTDKSQGISPDTILVFADDLMITGEQTTHWIKEVIDANGIDNKIYEVYLAGTDNYVNGFRSQHTNKRVDKVIKVFHVPDLDEIGFFGRDSNFTIGSYVMTFFDHRVSDRFVQELCRSRGDVGKNLGSDGTPHWLVDDMWKAPPYDKTRFSPGGKWWGVASRIPRDFK